MSNNFFRTFFHFGAGSAALAPLKKARYGNALAWAAIVVTAIGWAVLIWLLP